MGGSCYRWRGIQRICIDSAFSPKGSLLATGGEDSYVHIWDAETGRLAMSQKFAGPILEVAFAESGGFLAVAPQFGGGAAVDLNTEDRSPAEVLAEIQNGTLWRANGRGLVRNQNKISGPTENASIASDSSDIKNYALIKEFKTPEAAVEIFVSALIAADKNTLAQARLAEPNPSITQVLESPDTELATFGELFQGEPNN